MIEKLDIELTQSVATNNCIINKINELVDAVNGILAAQEQYATIYNEDIVPMLTPQNETPADPYAEQRKWIGKLCRFRDNDGDKWNYGILKSINNIECSFPFKDMEDYEWAICEPVKPDSDIIYKGGDNE